MPKKKIILIGTSLFGEIALNYFSSYQDFEVIGFAVEKKFKNNDQIYGLPLYEFENLDEVAKKFDQLFFFVSVVYSQLNTLRERLYIEAKNKGLKPASYISKNAFIDRNTKIGEHAFIFENNVIQHGSDIGNNVVLWSGNHIGHHSKIEDNCFISSHCVISGNTKIGKNSFLGVNSTVSNDVQIGSYCWISPSSIIGENLVDETITKSQKTEISKIKSKKFFRIT